MLVQVSVGQTFDPPVAGARSDAAGERPADRELVDAFLRASRALVAVAARSLAGLEDEVTLPQFRVLVVLATQGTQRAADLASTLQVSPSTASRMVERLVRKGLVRRGRTKGDRRSVQLQLTDTGRQVVAEVGERRRAEIETILGHLPQEEWSRLTDALVSFATAAGETPELDWALGWEA